MEMRLRNILKTTNIKKFIKTNLKRTCKVVLGTYNLVAQTRPVCLLRAVEFRATFDEKNCEVILFRSLTLVSGNTPKVISTLLSIAQKRHFKKMKI